MVDKLRGELHDLRRAAILAYASIMGGAAACRSYRVTEKSLYNWRLTAESDADFRELVERKRREYEEAWVVSQRARHLPAAPSAAESTAALAQAVVASVSAVAEFCGLPPVAALARPRHLPPAQRPDLLLMHAADSFTACLMLKHRAERRHEREQRVIGRLLLLLEDARLMIGPEEVRLTYLEGARLLCCVAPACVRPVVLGDYDPGPVFRRAL